MVGKQRPATQRTSHPAPPAGRADRPPSLPGALPRPPPASRWEGQRTDHVPRPAGHLPHLLPGPHPSRPGAPSPVTDHDPWEFAVHLTTANYMDHGLGAPGRSHTETHPRWRPRPGMFLRAFSLPVLGAIGGGPGGQAAGETGSDTGRKFSLASGKA